VGALVSGGRWRWVLAGNGDAVAVGMERSKSVGVMAVGNQNGLLGAVEQNIDVGIGLYRGGGGVGVACRVVCSDGVGCAAGGWGGVW